MAGWTVVLVDLDFEAVSGVRVGGGREGSLGTDAPVLRDHRGPLVPGSSLKGVLRSAAERVLRGAERDGGPRLACDVLTGPCGGLPGRPGSSPPAYEDLCRACRLFGSHWRAGRLTAGDLVADGATTVVRDGVAIDRDELKAADRLKYDFEVVVPGSRFRGRLRVDDPEPGELGLVAALVDLIDLGVVTVGGGASRGLGCLRLAAPLTARRLDAATWAPDAEPAAVDLAAERRRLREVLEGAGS